MDEGAGFSGGPADGGSSRYKGVRLRKWGKWVSEIRLPNSRERIWLGSYDSPEKAARAFDAALYCLRGRQAQFNFPDSPPDIAGAQGLTPQEIRAVAARFANQGPEGSGRSRRNDDGHGASSMAAREGGDNGNGNDGGGSSMDWSFLNALDVDCDGSGFGLYDGLDYVGGSQLEPPPEASSTTDNADDENGGGNGFYCHQLWNF